MSNDTTLTTLENILRENMENENEGKHHLQLLQSQLESKERELEQAEKRAQEAVEKSEQADKIYEDLLGYFNLKSQPRELRSAVDRLQGESNRAKAASEEVSKRAQFVRDLVQEAKRSLEEQKQRIKTLAEDQEKIRGHINNAKQGNIS
jgi:chromosome segregation ATPase